MGKQDQFDGISNTETGSFERKSLLDPHMSVLELLERTGDKQRGERVYEKKDVMGGSNCSISNSWQAIHRNEAIVSSVPERCSSQAAAVGVLSSSDTSEEEIDPSSSPNMTHFAQFHQPQQPQRYPFMLDVPVILPGREQDTAQAPRQSLAQDNEEEGDDETLIKSLSNSSNSFVMPKLSLSQKSHRLRILILGRPGLKFYQSIPKRYQHFFEVSQLQNPSEFRQYTGILIVFQELKEMVSLLNRVCQCTPTRPVIPVCQTGQHQQVRNVLESLLKSKLITLLYPPVVISNHSDLNNMYRFLQDLSKTISDNSEEDDDDEEDRELVDKKMKKSHQRKKKRASSYDKSSKPRKRKYKGTRVNKWIVWGVSLTVGVGVGYCMSYLVSSGLIPLSVKSIASIDGYHPNDNVAVFDDSSLGISEYDHDIENPFAHALYLFKQTLKQWNWAVKQFLIKHLPLVEPFSPEWTSEDNSNRVLALGYILL